MSELLSLNNEREKVLKVLKENPKENGREINRLLLLIRNDYRTILIEHPTLSNTIKKDIDNILWKQCFYKQIEEYRKSIKKTLLVIETEGNLVLVDKAKEHLSKLSNAFTKFLNDSTIFYQDLLLHLENNFKSIKQSKQTKVEHSNLFTCLLQNIHRCLIRLGDLSRYRVLHSQDNDKDFSESIRYYKRAAFVYPESGNPYNQIAVLSTYINKDFDVMYNYTRSILCEMPFSTGSDNLISFFDKTNRLYNNISTDSLLYLINNQLDNTSDRRSKDSTIKLKVLQLLFIKIFQFIIKYVLSIKSTNASIEPIDINEFDVILRDLLLSFDDYINLFNVSETIINELIVITIFTVHYSTIYEIFDRSNVLTNESISHYRTIPESLAVIVLFSLINKIAAVICRLTNSSSTDKNKKSIVNRLITSLSIFSEWLTSNPKYGSNLVGNIFDPIDSVPSNELITIYSIIPVILSNESIIRSENRSRSSMKSSLGILTDFIQDQIKRFELSSFYTPSSFKANSKLPLKEHLELRGFLPLRETIESYFANVDPLTNYPPHVLSEEPSRDRRLRNIKILLNDVLLFDPKESTKEATSKKEKPIDKPTDKSINKTKRSYKQKSNKQTTISDDEFSLSDLSIKDNVSDIVVVNDHAFPPLPSVNKEIKSIVIELDTEVTDKVDNVDSNSFNAWRNNNSNEPIDSYTYTEEDSIDFNISSLVNQLKSPDSLQNLSKAFDLPIGQMYTSTADDELSDEEVLFRPAFAKLTNIDTILSSNTPSIEPNNKISPGKLSDMDMTSYWSYDQQPSGLGLSPWIGNSLALSVYEQSDSLFAHPPVYPSTNVTNNDYLFTQSDQQSWYNNSLRAPALDIDEYLKSPLLGPNLLSQSQSLSPPPPPGLNLSVSTLLNSSANSNTTSYRSIPPPPGFSRNNDTSRYQFDQNSK